MFRPVGRGADGDYVLDLLLSRATADVAPADAVGTTYEAVHHDPDAALGTIVERFRAMADRCDAVLVVSAPAPVQRQRVLARPGMSEDRLAAILAKQMPDAEKRRRAHFLVDTGRGFAPAEAQVRSILACLAGRPGRVLAPRRRSV